MVSYETIKNQTQKYGGVRLNSNAYNSGRLVDTQAIMLMRRRQKSKLEAKAKA